ncbi:ATP-binding cassette domain-containing protein [Salmonella enterica]|nr:ATP-binding cassette domain-containing protein [Salmonella enterica]EAX4058422.1 ATP-binding cassette domain-containing protein [Salmonella enterica]EDW9230055.1 ATP-binding cassette domain-containing protein [Salmonella enterica]
MIKLENLTKQFVQKKGQPLKAVDNVNLNVPEGEMCVLLGPSGCGKTTTLKMINRLIAPSSGNILINGENTNDMDTVTLRRNIGYVIQQIGLFPNMTIEENITVVPRMLGWDKALKLGDRIAVFRQGRIVQCASPDELLAKPANEFVGSFVGQDRTLKRLLLVSAGDVTDQQPTITARPSTPLSEAFGIMDDHDIRAITVIDNDGKPLGFVKRREARNASGTCADITHPFRITGKAEDNLRIVLSRLYESNTSWMPIVDEDGRYNGEISQDYIADYLSSGRTRRALNIHESS